MPKVPEAWLKGGCEGLVWSRWAGKHHGSLGSTGVNLSDNKGQCHPKTRPWGSLRPLCSLHAHALTWVLCSPGAPRAELCAQRHLCVDTVHVHTHTRS